MAYVHPQTRVQYLLPRARERRSDCLARAAYLVCALTRVFSEYHVRSPASLILRDVHPPAWTPGAGRVPGHPYPMREMPPPRILLRDLDVDDLRCIWVMIVSWVDGPRP